ncbi:YibE/F family protein [Candidatus Dojkabacteria bacterium]|uniref:YibE/F family protein n=1 Tax=Candidatus Dojkabacteria bacterium TaxID=2099670 RepID=A0A955L6X6_9BACT|nr:YibE/F family protein [Candidatus Dojkabacteria bacterium]
MHSHSHTHSHGSSSSHGSLEFVTKIIVGIIGFSILTFLFILATNTSVLVGLLGGFVDDSEVIERTYHIGVVKTIQQPVEEIVDNSFPQDIPVEITLENASTDNSEIIAMVNQADRAFVRPDGEILLHPGDDVVVLQIGDGDYVNFFVADHARIQSAIFAIIIFFLVAAVFAGYQGISSFIGLIVSILILVLYIVPQILGGGNPMFVSLIGSLGIVVPSMYFAHGFSKRTTIALVSTLAVIVLTVILAWIFVYMTGLQGLGSEEVIYIDSFSTEPINLKGLLLGGIIIGTLGVLDDITTAQTAVVDELSKANKRLTMKELYIRASSVGKEHISSLINTLVLAYAGAAFPIFILLVANQGEPLWVILNREFIIEELVRTIVGSTTLILTVPITTLLAATIYAPKKEIS